MPRTKLKIPPHPMPDGKPLKRGDVVYALRPLPGIAPGIQTSDFGIVFEEGNAYGDGGGPMVRFVGGQMGNVYAGDVTKSYAEAADLRRLGWSLIDAKNNLHANKERAARERLRLHAKARPKLEAQLKAAQKAYDAALKKYTK